MLYLCESLTNTNAHCVPMIGLLTGKAIMHTQLTNLGLHQASFPDGTIRGHTFHYSTLKCTLTPLTHTKSAQHHGTPEPIYRTGKLTASFLHYYFPSNPEVTAQLFLP
ncbi:MAG TPA: hypothetical protein EYN67_20600 [Flavobacteriales bacterium]|nr:hypothetical protein [Flavobacteriales bacterium]